MWIFIVVAIALSLGITQSGVTEIFKREQSVEARRAANEIGQFRSFSYAATQYALNAEGPFTPGQKITWDPAIKNAPWTPPGARNVQMPSDWYIQMVNPSATPREFVLCSRLSERAVASLSQLMPEETSLYGVAEGSGVNPNDRLVFAKNETEAQTLGTGVCE